MTDAVRHDIRIRSSSSAYLEEGFSRARALFPFGSVTSANLPSRRAADAVGGYEQWDKLGPYYKSILYWELLEYD